MFQQYLAVAAVFALMQVSVVNLEGFFLCSNSKSRYIGW